jgi:peptidoglycan/xylan/chitin deacetylase (PgdA/CDA1 family)
MGDKTRRVILESIFRLKRNFAPNIPPAPRFFDGVEITPFRGGVPASATISADFELSWAWRGWRSAEETRLRAARERRNVSYLVALLEEYAIPITWATVGHLFLERCEPGTDGRAHPHMPRPVMTRPPAMARWTGDWYAHDPCSDYRSDPLWYCPDLIRLILSSRVRHEIASHSFSHISFLTDNSTPDLVRQEIAQCQAAMSRFGVVARSLVYPYNQMGHQYAPVLAQLGITCVRHRDPVIRLSYPERLSCGVYKLYESMNLRRSRRYNYIDKVRIFLDETVKRHAAYHIWFHPSDSTELFEHEFYEIIQEIAARRREGKLWVTTMADLASYCEARERTTLEVRRQASGLTITLRSGYDAKRYGQTNVTLRIASDQLPVSCSVRVQDRSEPVKWKYEGTRRGKREPCSFFVDVPVNARQLFVSFQKTDVPKTERSPAIASSAFG